jgi:hypothetical protein
MSLDESIRDDGAADLVAQGVTGAGAYNINQTARGLPYRHPVTARFDGGQGQGQWTTTRVCRFTFTRR